MISAFPGSGRNFRVSQGRIDMTGAMTMAPSFDSAGWFAASPGVFKLAGKSLLVGDYDEHEISNAVLLQDAFDNADAGVADLCRAFLKKASNTLPAIKSSQIAGPSIDAWREAMRVRQAYETWKTYGPFVTRVRPELGPGIKERMDIAASITDAEYDATEKILDQAKNRAQELAAPGTILILPTAPCIAPMLQTSQQDLNTFRTGVMRLVCIASISGLPQVSIPIGTVNQAPVGLSLIGWRNGDEALLTMAEGLAKHVGIAA